MIVIEILLLLYFAYISLYSFILSVAGLFYRTPRLPEAKRFRKIAVFIPAYKEDRVIIDVAYQASLQHYPKEYFDVIIIADSLQAATIQKLRNFSVTVVEVSFDKSTKVKSLNRAISTVGDSYEYALVLDADNVMEKDFLAKMNRLLEAGHRAIQGQRTSKNQTSSMSLLDGLSERINNYIYRQGSVAFGISSSLIGSGMIFEYPVLKEILIGLDSVGGFDRELELNIIKRGIRIYYAKDAVVYDEKVENAEVFEKQRRRWLSSQFIYLKKYFFSGWSSLFRGNLSFFNSAILKNIQLPRLLNLGMLTIILLLSFIFQRYLTLSPYTWVLLLVLNIVAMMLAIPKKMYSWELVKSIFLLPGLFLKMFNLLFKLKGANKEFLHTPHGLNTPPANEKK